MSNRMKIALWGLVIVSAMLVVLVTASNLALLFLGTHDGRLHLITIYKLLMNPSESESSAARLALIAGGAAGFFVVAALWQAGTRKPLHGAARWASEREIKKAGLRESRGIVVGKLRGRYLIFGGSEHVIVYAPTRGGKGVGIVIPNLLNWPDSTIVLDVKKENWELTAGFRKSAGQEVHLFDPFDPEGRTSRYNPLAYVRRDNPDELYDGLQRIAGMLFPVEGRTIDPFWTESARSAFIAIAGYVAETPELPFTIGEVLRQLAAAPDIKGHFQEILKQRAKQRQLSPTCRTAMNDFLAASENTLQSIRKSATSKLGLWLNTRVDAATSANDFDLRELRRRPISIYLGVTPDNLQRMAPLLNLFFQQAVELNTRTLPAHDSSLKLQVMLMMDEFRAMGNVEIIAKGVSYIAGYGLRIVTIIQSPAQLREIYGPDAAVNYMTNHAVEVVFAPKEHAVAKELSERIGYDTVKGRSRSRGIGFSRSSRTETTSDQPRALMLPQELVLTPFEDEYVIKAGIPAVKARKILYFEDPAFKRRLLPPPKMEPMRRGNKTRIEILERKIEALSTSLAAKVVRAPRLDEVAADEQPADGEDGTVWVLPNDLETAFKDVKLSDDLEKNRATAEKQVAKWLDTVAGELDHAHDVS